MQYATKAEMEALAMKVAAMQEDLTLVKNTLTTLNPNDVKELTALLKQVKDGLKTFNWIGKVIKKLVWIGAPIVAIWYGINTGTPVKFP